MCVVALLSCSDSTSLSDRAVGTWSCAPVAVDAGAPAIVQIGSDKTFTVFTAEGGEFGGNWDLTGDKVTLTGPAIGEYVYGGVNEDGGEIHVSERLHEDSGVFDVDVHDEDHVTFHQVSSFEGEPVEATDANDRQAIVFDCRRQPD